MAAKSGALRRRGRNIIDNLYVHSSERKIDTLTDLICRAGDDAFTEQGIAMLSTVLRSNRAISVNVESHSGILSQPR